MRARGRATTACETQEVFVSYGFAQNRKAILMGMVGCVLLELCYTFSNPMRRVLKVVTQASRAFGLGSRPLPKRPHGLAGGRVD